MPTQEQILKKKKAADNMSKLEVLWTQKLEQKVAQAVALEQVLRQATQKFAERREQKLKMEIEICQLLFNDENRQMFKKLFGDSGVKFEDWLGQAMDQKAISTFKKNINPILEHWEAVVAELLTQGFIPNVERNEVISFLSKFNSDESMASWVRAVGNIFTLKASTKELETRTIEVKQTKRLVLNGIN